MDAVFGRNNLRGEIIWRRTNANGLAFKGYPLNNDILLCFTKSQDFIRNRPFRPHTPDYIENFYRHVNQKRCGGIHRATWLTRIRIARI